MVHDALLPDYIQVNRTYNKVVKVHNKKVPLYVERQAFQDIYTFKINSSS